MAVTSTAVSITASAVGLAADAAVGTVRIVGKGVGKAADLMLDDPQPSAVDAADRLPVSEPSPEQRMPAG